MLTINGVHLNDPAGRWQLDSETSLRRIGEISSTLIQLPHQTIALYDTHVGFTTRTIVIQINADSYTQMMTYRALLDAQFAKGGKLVLQETLADGTILTADCELVSATPTDYGIGDLSSTLTTYTVRIPAGIYQSTTPTTPTVPAGASITIPSLQGGSAPIPDPVFILTPTAAGPTVFEIAPVNDPDAWIRFAYTAPNLTPITVDTKALTAIRAGAALTGRLDAGPKPFYIPANTNLVVTASNLTVKVSARKAWY